MVKQSRAAMLILALALTVSIAFMSPASATYKVQPVANAWAAPGPVHATTVSAGRLYVGYHAAEGVGGIAALDASTGSLLWSADTNGDVRALTLSADGTRLFAGGAFTSVEGATHRHLVALSPLDGAVLDAWKPATSGTVRDLVVVGDPLYVGGMFAAMNRVAQRGLGAVSVNTGTRIESFTAFTDDNVYGLAKSGSRLIVSGKFTQVNGVARSSLAAFDLTSGQLTPWAPERICPGCGSYFDIATDARNVYVAASGPGGWFGAYDLATGVPPWPALRASGNVQALTVGGDGLIYIGGHFSRYVGHRVNARSQLAAVIAATGVVDPHFTPWLYKTYPGVWAMASTPRRLYVGGDFTGVRVRGVSNKVPFFATFAARSTGPGPCTGVRDCSVVATVDVNGDGAADSVGLARRGADGARNGVVDLRVQTSTGKLAGMRLPTHSWSGNAWQGAARLDGHRGKDLVLGRSMHGRSTYFQALTWRAGKLVLLDAPGPARYWQTSTGAKLKAGWLHRRVAPAGVIVKRVAERVRNAGQNPYRGSLSTYHWTRQGWVRGSTHVRASMPLVQARRWSGWHVAGLGRL